MDYHHDERYIKDLKKAYRILRKEKNEYPKGDEKRIELHNKMKEIKQKIHKASGGDMDPEKQKLIDKIIEFKKKNRQTIPELGKFSIAELEFHYMKITGQVTTKDEYNKLKGITIQPPEPAPVNPFSATPKEVEVVANDEEIEPAAHSPIEAGIRRVRRYK
jgi:hypothetical protein